jgi:hypothetical protein
VQRLTLVAAAGAVALCFALTAPAAEPTAGNADALAQLTRALAAQEAQQGKTSPYLLPIIEQLALLRLRGGELAEAAALRRRALAIALARFGSDSASAAEAMVALAQLEIDRRRYLDAEPLLIIAGNALAGRVAADHPVLAALAAARARIALARGEAAEAIALGEQAVAIARRNPHRRTTEPLRALGAALAVVERFAEAEKILGEALAQDRRQHGADGLDTARSLAQLANLHIRSRRFAEALPLIEEAVAIDQARLGAAHPFIADDLSDLGHALSGLRHDATARRAFSAAIALLERGEGRNTPRLAYAELELSRLDRQQGRTAQADAGFKDARRILNQAEDEERRRERSI